MLTLSDKAARRRLHPRSVHLTPGRSSTLSTSGAAALSFGSGSQVNAGAAGARTAVSSPKTRPFQYYLIDEDGNDSESPLTAR